MRDIAERFGKLMVEAAEMRRKKEEKERWTAHWAANDERVRAMFEHLSLDEMRALWDAVCDDKPCEFCCDDIWAELNRRGDGEYCAV